MSKSLTEIAKAVLMNENANAATLRPKANYADAPQGLEVDVDIVGDAPKAPGEGSNVGADASSKMKKDTSASSQSRKGAVAAVKAKNQAEVMEEDAEVDGGSIEEDFELSEELQAFIDEQIAAGLSEDEIAQAIDENFELIPEESEDIAEEAEEYQVDMSEHVEALLSGEDLSEEFKEKALTIFEAAVRQKVEEEIARLEEAYAEALEEEVSSITQSLSEDVDDYLNYVVENWVSENEVAIEHGLRTELTEDFISGLRNLFTENYIDIPEDKVSVVEELGAKIEELESKLNEEIEHNVALNKMVNESKQYEIVSTSCDGLTTTQAEKLKALSEGIEFTSESQYGSKIRTLRESYFPTNVMAGNVLDRVESDSDGKSLINEGVNPRMDAYVKTIGKKLPT